MQLVLQALFFLLKLPFLHQLSCLLNESIQHRRVALHYIGASPISGQFFIHRQFIRLRPFPIFY